MKHSIRFKITFTLTLMVVLIIGITWIINKTFLSYYYVQLKTDSLVKAYNEVIDIYQNSDSTGYLSDDDTDKMERLALKYNIKVTVINQNIAVIYPAVENFGKREWNSLYGVLQGYIFKGSVVGKIKLLEQKDNYYVCRLYDQVMDSNYIDLIGYFDNPVENVIIDNPDNTNPSLNNESGSIGNSENALANNSTDPSDSSSNQDNQESNDSNAQDNAGTNNNSEQELQNGSKVDTMVIIRSNFESIEESTRIANEFLAYVGIIVIVFGTLAMFIVSRKFSKPIQDLSGIAKQMTDLNFDVKYNIKTNDEIGELGKSINSLSDKLETTITELKQANNELQTDIQHKIEIDEMRKEFLSNVSHELKTPISLIQGYAEGLKENINDDEESRDFYCEVIIDEANKMNQMVKKLLSLNELEFGNSQVNFERFDIVSLIRSVISATEILFKQKEATLLFEQSEPVYVWADEYLIEQVVTNYISNALNHVNGQKIIEIKLIPRKDTVRIAIFNTGDNIPEEDLDKLWIKFYKVDKARTREYGGNGIGLSIVKAIMNSHNRECGVINRPIGVEFWFELDSKS